MSLWNRIASTLRPRKLDTELNEELQFHLMSRMRDGMTGDQARRALGGYDRTVEACRDADGVRWMENAWRDFRYALRTLRASPLFTLTAVLSLALGIGANTAVFTLLRATLWKPLPVAQPEELVHVMRITPSIPDSDGSYSYALFQQIRAAAAPFGDVAAVGGFRLQKFGTDKSSSERIVGEGVSGNFFSLLRVAPALGRLIGPEDDSAAGSNAVVVLSHRFWTRRFQSDPSVIGRAVWFGESPYTVVGVAQRTFTGVEAETEIDAWVPTTAERPREWLKSPDYNWLRFLARFPPGAKLPAIQATLDGVFRAHMAEVLLTVAEPHRSIVATHRLVLRPAGAGLSSTGRRYQKPLLVLLAVVALVLLISCANVANLILARNAARGREIAVRLALGAGRRRIAAQLLAESLLLASVGATAGVALAEPVCRLLVNLMPQSNLPLAYNFRPDATVLGFTAAVATMMAVIFGLIPALSASKRAWQSGARATGRSRIGHLLVAGQLALSLLLLIGAGLFLDTVRNLQSIDLGFRAKKLLTFSVDFPKGTPEPRIRQTYASIREQLEGMPGVSSVTHAWPGLYAGGGWSRPVEREGQPTATGDVEEVGALSTGPGFFETVGMGLVEGRYPTERDAPASVAVVNEKLARRLFGNESAVGRRIRLPQQQPEFREVIGVVRTAKHYGAREKAWPMVYFPGDRGTSKGAFLVRTQADVRQMSAAIRTAVAAAGAGQAQSIRTVDSLVEATMGRERLVAALSTVFGALATLLAAIGLYGVLAYAVSRRTAELAIRMALGAQRRDVQWMVLRESLQMAAAGTAVGLAAAYAATRFIATMLYGVKPTDALIFAASALLLAAVAAVAGFLPARRASRIDPMVALRYE